MYLCAIGGYHMCVFVIKKGVSRDTPVKRKV